MHMRVQQEQIYQVRRFGRTKNSISVAVAEDGRGGKVRYMGTIPTTTATHSMGGPRSCPNRTWPASGVRLTIVPIESSYVLAIWV